MLAVDPAAIDWTVAEVEIDDGFTTDQFTGSAARMTVVAYLDELVAWATATFVPSFAWSWQRESATSGAIITVTASSAVTLEATNTDAQDGLGYPAGVIGPATDFEADASAAGTWAPRWSIMVRADLRILARGDACGDGAIRPGSPGIAHRRPAVTAAGTARDAARLSSVLASAASPRRAVAYQLHTATWPTFALGTVDRSPLDTNNYRFALQAVGDVI